MDTLTIKLNDQKALEILKDLEEQHLIEIIEHLVPDSLALPGEEISEEDFRKWAESAESAPSVSLNEAKMRWDIRKKKIKNPEK